MTQKLHKIVMTAEISIPNRLHNNFTVFVCRLEYQSKTLVVPITISYGDVYNTLYKCFTTHSINKANFDVYLHTTSSPTDVLFDIRECNPDIKFVEHVS